MILWLPGTWQDRNKILYFKHASTNFLTSFMIARFLDVDLFMISTTPELSVIKMIQWLARNFPNNSTARTKGYSSNKVMSAEVKGLCHVPATHFFPKTAAKHMSLEASVYNLIVSDDRNVWSRNILLSLNDSKNICQAYISARASQFNVTKWCSRVMPTVKLIKRRRNAVLLVQPDKQN